MRIAMLSSFYSPHQGGTERYVKDLSHALADRGHEVTVFTHTRGPVPEGPDKIHIRRLPALWLGYLPIGLSSLAPELEGFDIIHSHIPPFAFSGRLPKELPHVVTYHCDSVLPESYRGVPVPGVIREGYRRLAEKQAGRILDEASSVIVTSEDYAASSVVLKGRRVRALPIGMHMHRFYEDLTARKNRKADALPYFLYVGRLAASKGLDILFRAAGQLRSMGHPFYLELIGEGEERGHLEKLRRRLGLEHTILFRGRVSRDELLYRMGRSTALILPSVSPLEAFGIVQQEALAMKTPVIASNLPGVRQVIRDSGGGRLVEPGNVDELGSAMKDWILDREGARKTGLQGYTRLKDLYDWKKIARELEGIYEGCLKGSESA